MQYLRSNTTFVLIVSLFLFFKVTAQDVNHGKYGYLVGNAIFVDENARTNLGDAKGIILELKHKRKIFKINADSFGNISKKLPTGKFCLLKASTDDDVKLRFSLNQGMCFVIKKDQSERFDVMLLKPLS